MTRENGLSLILLHRTDLPSSKRNRAALHQKAIKKRLKNWSCALTGASQVATGYRTCWEVPQWLGNISPRILSTQPKSHGSKTPTRSLREQVSLPHSCARLWNKAKKTDLLSFDIFQKQNFTYLPFLQSEEEKHFAFNCPDGDHVINFEVALLWWRHAVCSPMDLVLWYESQRLRPPTSHFRRCAWVGGLGFQWQLGTKYFRNIFRNISGAKLHIEIAKCS